MAERTLPQLAKHPTTENHNSPDTLYHVNPPIYVSPFVHHHDTAYAIMLGCFRTCNHKTNPQNIMVIDAIISHTLPPPNLPLQSAIIRHPNHPLSFIQQLRLPSRTAHLQPISHILLPPPTKSNGTRTHSDFFLRICRLCSLG